MKKPWNLANSPVYSLATYSGEVFNMNICTYVSAISLKPKQYMIAVYKNTYSLDLLNSGATCVLQLLAKNQLSLVRNLGQKSGYKFDKRQWLSKNDLLDQWNGYTILKEAVAFVELEEITQVDTKGDHLVFCFDVLRSKTKSEEQVLMFQDLVDAKVIL